jgi:hypothetical protein
MFGRVTLENRNAPREGELHLSCRVVPLDSTQLEIADIEVNQQTVGGEPLVRAIERLLAGTRVSPESVAGSVRQYHLRFALDIYHTRVSGDSTWLVVAGFAGRS